MKKVLFLINTLSGGGAEKVLIDLVNHLDHKKYDVTLQTVFNEGVYQDKLNKNIRYKYIFHQASNPVARLIQKLGGKYICLSRNLKGFYSRHISDNYDVEIAFLEGIPTKILAFSDAPKKIAWVHTDLSQNYQGMNRVYDSVKTHKACYDKYDRIICVSKSAQSGFKKCFGTLQKTQIIYNPINPYQIYKNAAETVTEINVPDKLVAVAVGRLFPQKGYDRLLRIHKRLMDEMVDYELWILGDGIDRKWMHEYIEENHLQDGVKLLGFQKNPYKFIRIADLFVCSSYVEALSTVAIEALILGKPCVTVACSGMKEIFGDSQYGLVTNNDEEALYKGFKQMLTSKEQRDYYQMKAEQWASEFRMETKITEIEALLDK